MSAPSIPAGAIEALRASHGEKTQRQRYGRQLFDLDYETVGLEAAPEGVLFGLARDCPFDEIAPGLLAIFVQQLQELTPDVSVQHIAGYRHPIVARLPVDLPHAAPAEVWAKALAELRPRLEQALRRQDEAVERFRQAREGSFNWEWPEVEVTQEQLHRLAGLADAYAPSNTPSLVEAPYPDMVKLEQLLKHYGVIDRRESWVKWLQLRELDMGYWEAGHPRGLNASQLVVLLRALFDGARYSPPLLERAYRVGLLQAIFVRCRQLAG